MKTFLILALLTSSAFASELPAILRNKIEIELQDRIPCLDKASVKEIMTLVRADRIDQGVVDYYYTSTFSFRYFFHGNHARRVTLVVKSAEYSGWCQNDCNFKIEEMDTSNFICE
jgi:hypothetical protein